MKLKKLDNKGFSLMEMLVVLFIISLLLLLIIPNLNAHRKNAQDTGDEAFRSALQTQVDLYLMNHPNTSTVTIGDLELSLEQANRATALNATVNGDNQVVISNSAPAD